MGLFAGAVRRARGTPEPELNAARAACRGQHPRGETGWGWALAGYSELLQEL